MEFDVGALAAQDKEWRSLVGEIDLLRRRRNEISGEINELMRKKSDASEKIREAKALPAKIKELEDWSAGLRNALDVAFLSIPNIPHDSVPVGSDASHNVVVRSWGKKPNFSFTPKHHWELGEQLNILDLDRSAKIAGTGFYVLRGDGARLQRALIQFMLDFHFKNGFVEVCPPLLVNAKTMRGTGQLPKFEQDLYQTREGLYLIPTAEVPLTNLHAGENLLAAELPKRYCAFTPCFRTEAGRHGTETRGIFRLHQFDKVEMVSICAPEQSWKELEFLRREAEQLLEQLRIPYQTIVLCTGDMGFAAAKTYDLECWSPALGKFLETSSVSNCTDFQARRMQTKYFAGPKTALVNTLNGSGLALPRLFISLLENNQTARGTVNVPKVLQPYMGGLTEIGAAPKIVSKAKKPKPESRTIPKKAISKKPKSKPKPIPKKGLKKPLKRK